MTGISIYEATVPVFTKGLVTLSHILNQASAHATASSQDVDKTFADARLIEDMRPLTFQIIVATNIAKKSITRLTGHELDSWEDNESTFEQMQARLAKARALLAAQKPEDFANAEERTIELPLDATHVANVNGKEYVLFYALPNFLFHVQTAYSILRKGGVELGKKDYLTSFLSDKAVVKPA